MTDRAQAGPIGGDVQSVRQFIYRIIGGVLPRYAHGQDHFDPLVSPVTFSHENPPVRLRDLCIGHPGAARKGPPRGQTTNLSPLQNQSFRGVALVILGDSFQATDALNQSADSFCQRSISGWARVRTASGLFLVDNRIEEQIDER